MPNDTIILQVKKALAEAIKLESIDNLKINADLKEEYGLDSMSSLTFLMTLEDTIQGFKVNADTLDPEYLNTIEGVSKYVMQELQNSIDDN